jgi:flagellar protein FlaI
MSETSKTKKSRFNIREKLRNLRGKPKLPRRKEAKEEPSKKFRFPPVVKQLQVLMKFSKSPKAVVEAKFRAEPLLSVIDGEIIDKYMVDQAAVYVVDRQGKGYYLVQEPPLTEEEQRIYSLLMENLFYSLLPTIKLPEDPLKYVESFIYEVAEDLGLLEVVHKSFSKYKYYITKDAFGYGPLHVLMNDPNIEEVSCVSYGLPVTVIHRKISQYDWLESNVVFSNEDEVGRFVQKLAQKSGKSATIAIPFIDAMTQEGDRIAVTFSNEVTLPGSTFCIRKFPIEPLSMANLIKFNTISPLMAAYLWILVEHRGFVLTIGPMSSGKTTMLNCLLTMISPNLKIVTVEDTPEIKIPHKNWERFKARRAYAITETKYDVNLFDLVRLSLRYRPDYISVGEIRGEEAKALIQAAALGHGAVSTLHAENPFSAFIRLTTTPMEVEPGSLGLISAIVTLHRIRMPDGSVSRRVVDISEVVLDSAGKPQACNIFTRDPTTDEMSPSTAEEVVARSKKLELLTFPAGWNKQKLLKQLKIRTKYLRDLVEQDKTTYDLFSSAMFKFYGEVEKDAA